MTTEFAHSYWCVDDGHFHTLCMVIPLCSRGSILGNAGLDCEFLPLIWTMKFRNFNRLIRTLILLNNRGLLLFLVRPLEILVLISWYVHISGLKNLGIQTRFLKGRNPDDFIPAFFISKAFNRRLILLTTDVTFIPLIQSTLCYIATRLPASFQQFVVANTSGS